MSFLRCIRHSSKTCGLFAPSRRYAVKASAPAASPAGKNTPVSEEPAAALSSCPPNTVLTGLNYLKGQEPVLALPDEDYPPWLWDLLKPREFPDDGPGGKGEKMRMRMENRQRIRDQNFMKTQ
ncbi:mitochondrial/chloroplast ribosomal protein L54/L37 [Amylostereum chailletii]|nr:mitochondrial/chloroplast ribosomal protein L54/L37 [Amylostereum chailletii]